MEIPVDDGIVLYTYWRSSAAYRVRIGLELKGLAWEARPVHLVREGGEQHLDAYRALNSQQLVPTLLHEGHALTQSLAQEVAQFGVTVNAVLPGDIDTGMKQWGYQLEAQIMQRSYNEVVAAGVARIPAGRLGAPQDVAGLVAYLASDEASFITGQLFPVTGGRELG